MKKIFLIALVVSIGHGVSAQKWKEKIKAAGEKVNSAAESAYGIDNKDYTAEYETKEFPDMMTYLNNWEGKVLKQYIRDSREARLFAKDNAKVEYIKEGDIIKSIKIDTWTYTPKKDADSDKIKNFNGTRGSLYMNEENIAVYKTNTEGDVFVQFLYGPKQSLNKIQTEIKYYNIYTEGLINTDKNAAQAERTRIAAEKEAARLKKYGLADKDVKSIEVVASVPAKFGYFIPFDYEIVATLKNGTEIKTGNGEGYIEDYIVSTPKRDFNGAIESGFLSSDELIITAKLKKNPSISSTKKIPIPYNSNLQFQYYGKGWSKSAGDDGYDVTVKIKQENHSVTGKPILRVRIESNASYATVREFSISPDKSIIIDCHGGDGGVDERYFPGGDGGNVRVLKDPSVANFYIDYDVSGGQAGGRSAANGRDGRYTVTEQLVNF